MAEELQLRFHGAESSPVLIYLPGLHGDWTLVGGFRRALAGRVRFVEITYPRTLTWTLDDYAANIESALAKGGIDGGWLLGESFGSQVLWAMVDRRRFRAEGVILAGGFVRHPAGWGVRLAEILCGKVSMKLVTAVLFGYAKIARLRFRSAPETLAGLGEFIVRRTALDLQAAQHRLRLIARNNLCQAARQCQLPVYAFTGLVDPVVPWPWVRSWLKRNCPALRDYRIVTWADHTVLATAPQRAAQLVVNWMKPSRDNAVGL